MGIIKTEKLGFDYIRRDDDGNVEEIVRALDDVEIGIEKGEFVAILGHNGSGKSTLAKHLNAILYPTEGTVWVDDMDTCDEGLLWNIRCTAGMVFQNPDNQIIAQLVEEDVAFGPENLGIPTKEIRERVKESLKAVGMEDYAGFSPTKLSGGQKQRVSIAGILAMHPKCIVLDEPTAMLDPRGRYEVMRALQGLNDVEKITIILITHNMEEAALAQRVIVMDHGHVVMEGSPRDVFKQEDKLLELRLDVPEITKLAHELRKCGIPIRADILTEKEMREELIPLLKGALQ